MSVEFILPDIGEGIVECEIVEWLVSEGDTIAEDQPVVDVMTDKALVQIPAMYAGVVKKLHYAKGDIAKVHAPLFEMEVEGSVTSAPAVEATPAPEASPEPVAQTPVIQDTTPVSGGVEDFILPDIGEGIVECEIVEWLVAEGDDVKEDQPVCDVMTDKALVQIPSKYNGKIVKLHYAKGDIAKVHAPLFAIEVEGAAATVSTSTTSQEPAPVTAPASVASTSHTQVKTEKPVAQGKALASPAVRRLAREKGVDIALVPGSGDKGRVYKQDVIDFVNGKHVATTQPPEVNVPAVVENLTVDHVEPIRGVKAAMAKQMTASASTIPHFTYCDDIDMTDLIALRKSLKEKYAKQGIKLTLMPFIMKAMSLAIKEYPVLNSRVNDECTEVTYLNSHNIGMAVDSKVGLIVPNVKNCQTLSMLQIAEEVTRLTNGAREGRVSPNDIKEGTITISNIGAIGGTIATPIINKPEVAIVALGKVQSLPRFDEQGNVQARQIMQVSWSGDHRVIDGGTIARFCNLWKDYLEDPSKMLVEMV